MFSLPNLKPIKEQTFLETMAPKLGPSVIQNMNNSQMVAMRELLIRKNIFTREELTNETEVQLGKLADMIMKMPIPSPFNPQA